MKKIFVEKFITYIQTKKELTNIEIKRLKYGLEGLYNLITKMVVIFVLAILFNLLTELICFILIYSFFRLYGFGIHAKKSWQCWLSTIPIYIGGCFLIKYVSLSMPVIYAIWIFGIISFILFAPADTASRPLIHKEKRIRAKILSIIIVIFFYFINVYFQNRIFLNATLYALIIQSLSMNPLIYLLFHAPYHNYKTYSKTTV